MTEKVPEKATPHLAFKNVHEALLHVQLLLKNPIKTEKGNYGKYSALPDIRDAVVPILKDVGIYITQLVQVKDGLPIIDTVLFHAASETWLSSKMPLLLEKQTPQGMGSAITYARRYALCAALFIASDADDDGEAAEKKPPAKVVKTPPVKVDKNAPKPDWYLAALAAYKKLKVAVTNQSRDEFNAIWLEYQVHIDTLEKQDKGLYDELYALYQQLPAETK